MYKELTKPAALTPMAAARTRLGVEQGADDVSLKVVSKTPLEAVVKVAARSKAHNFGGALTAAARIAKTPKIVDAQPREQPSHLHCDGSPGLSSAFSSAVLINVNVAAMANRLNNVPIAMM